MRCLQTFPTDHQVEIPAGAVIIAPVQVVGVGLVEQVFHAGIQSDDRVS
jgi:hypothetical protein